MTPKITTDFLDELRRELYAAGKIPRDSDGSLFPLLGITRAQISRYRNKGDTFSDKVALRVADLLELDRDYVIACIHAEREKAPEVKSFWMDMARRVAAFGWVFVAGAIMAGSIAPSPAQAADFSEFSENPMFQTILIMLNRLCSGLFDGLLINLI